MVLLLLSLLLGLWYLQISNDCTFIKILACMTSPTPLDGAGKKVTLEPAIRVQAAAQFCTFSPSWPSASYCAWAHRGATKIPQRATSTSTQREWRLLETMRITAWFHGSLATDEALPWTLYFIKSLLCLNPSGKLWEFSLSVCWPKSSYSALATQREDEVCIPFP